MTLRDLTERERQNLIKLCADEFEMRNNGRPESKPFDWFTYRTAFSDGVRIAIKLLGPQ
jgi:hypothetical protein